MCSTICCLAVAIRRRPLSFEVYLLIDRCPIAYHDTVCRATPGIHHGAPSQGQEGYHDSAPINPGPRSAKFPVEKDESPVSWVRPRVRLIKCFAHTGISIPRR